MKKRAAVFHINIVLVFLLVLGALLAACTKPETSPSTTTPPATTPEPSPATEVIELKFGHNIGAQMQMNTQWEEWAKKVEERTDGKVKITIYPAETLVKVMDAYPALTSNVVDITYVVTPVFPAQFGLNNVLNLMSLKIPGDIRGVQCWDELNDQFPAMAAEFNDIHVLWRYVCASNFGIHTVEPVKTPDDVKGLKISTTGAQADYVKNAGAAPVDMPVPEWYMALERGLLEGCFANYTLIVDFGAYELTTNHLELNMGSTGVMVAMNKERWESLPADVQAVFDELMPEIREMEYNAIIEMNNDSKEKCVESDHTFLQPTAEELTTWLSFADPATQKWMEDFKAKGPTQEIYEYAQELLATKYK